MSDTNTLSPPTGQGSSQGPKLLDRFRAWLDVQPIAPPDRQRRLDWTRQFILFHRGRRPQEAIGNLFRHPSDMGADEVREFLRSVRAGLSETDFAQARDALLDFYAHVAGKNLRTPERRWRHGSGMPRSRQIFLANGSGISVWRGTAERRLFAGLPHHE